MLAPSHHALIRYMGGMLHFQVTVVHRLIGPCVRQSLCQSWILLAQSFPQRHAHSKEFKVSMPRCPLKNQNCRGAPEKVTKTTTNAGTLAIWRKNIPLCFCGLATSLQGPGRRAKSLRLRLCRSFTEVLFLSIKSHSLFYISILPLVKTVCIYTSPSLCLCILFFLEFDHEIMPWLRFFVCVLVRMPWLLRGSCLG